MSDSSRTRVRAFAPGGIGNIGPGLDILGCALTGAGDTVDARLDDASSDVRIEASGSAELPSDPRLHASAVAARAVLDLAGRRDTGLVLCVEKGLPLAGGQGGSAASAVAGAVAANELLGRPLDDRALVRAALSAEERVAGRHVDNIAPSLLGGILLIRRVDPVEFIRIPTPPWLRFALARPTLRLTTARARRALPETIDRETALAQASAVGAMIAAFWSADPAQLKGAIDDRIAEPARAPLIPGFENVKRAALDAGALGCSISGGGPTIFAAADGDESADRVLRAMLAAFASAGVEADGRVARVDQEGARVLERA